MVIDKVGLVEGDLNTNPVLLVNQQISRGTVKTTPYEFKFDPQGLVSSSDGTKFVYYKDNNDQWFREKFSNDGVFLKKDSYSFSELLNDEIIFDVDLNSDQKFGDSVIEVLTPIYPAEETLIKYNIANNDHFMFSIDPSGR